MYQNFSRLWAASTVLAITATAPAACAQVSAVKPLNTATPSTGVKYYQPQPIAPQSTPVRGQAVVQQGSGVVRPVGTVNYYPPTPVKPQSGPVQVQGQPVAR